ncbi:hypothetical protein [Sinomicrobium soli]|uniref:hypothetical protein n=1 Tax=Sinomicrobium sp. N-1-3-6 TaxID=2219864 RepID=UPI000DCD98B4|nr:hypothetical protein [Sinomicrobium sp. N-1-3-6]RAV30332.1 hypothetical protein DN748_02135 [Sinomicrobium sp. N-1-3-6]
MELDNIERYLEKYFEGSSSIAEEKALQDYFAGAEEHIAPHLREYAPVFRYFSRSRDETSTREIRIGTGRRKKHVYGWLSAAAVVAIAAGIWFSGYTSRDKEAEARLAYEETVQALYMIGENLNKGTARMEYLEEFDQTKKRILPERELQ